MEGSQTCVKCRIEKTLTEFHKNKRNKSGHHFSCKMCRNIKAKEQRQKYSRMETREIKENKVCSCCEEEKNVLEYSKNRCQKDGFANECKYCANKHCYAYIKARRRNDPEFKILGNLRSRLGQVLKRKAKSQTTQQLIGINFEIFIKWIKFQFEEGMSMENYSSVWEHDHVLPISSFNLLEEEELS